MRNGPECRQSLSNTPGKISNTGGDIVYRMLENCVKMECIGCRKLIPTHLFFEHLGPNTFKCGVDISGTQNSQNLSNMS